MKRPIPDEAMAKRRILALLVVVATSTLASVTLAQGPRVFILDGARLETVRSRIWMGNEELRPALEQLKRDADQAMMAGPFSVVNKDITPPSGDKRDYVSQAPYWWPNPDTPTGLPYIRRDGERNPEIYKIRNRLDMGEMIDAIETLALCFYFTGDSRYADRAALLMRAWFVEPATRMNPNLQFGQFIPGINTGRGVGLIESRLLVRVVDSLGLLKDSKSWTDADQRDMEQWFAQFLQWMRESDHGREEAAAKNNHGTYYDVQVASLALFLHQRELAIEVLRAAGKKRIAVQIEPDGRQPLELARTKAWSYSTGNLAGLMTLARLGEHVDVDLWNYETEDGRCIRAALDFLASFGLGEREWTYPQTGGFSSELFVPLLQIAAVKYLDSRYQALTARLPPAAASSRSMLVFSPLNSISRLHVR